MAFSSTCLRFHRLSVAKRYCVRQVSSCLPEKKGLVLGVYYDEKEGLELTPSAAKFNQISQGKLLDQIKLAGNKVEEGKSFLFWGVLTDFACVAVVGLGKKSRTFHDLELIAEDKESIRVAAAAGCKALTSVDVKDIQIESLGNAEAAAEGGELSTWKFQEYKTKKTVLADVSPYSLSPEEEPRWTSGIIKATSQNIARKLADTPANLMTPSIFAETVKELLTPLNVSVEIRDREWAEKEKMGAFLSVSRGSKEPPKFVEISLGETRENPFVLVGKGVTFDAGGISLKSPAAMDEMRADMSGAACVVGAIFGLASLKVPVNVKGLIPLVENLPSGTATKPGDLVTARNGKTICVDDTDAEGRLILADALAYSEIFKPKWVLDIATLTGAVRTALGSAAAGVFSNSNRLYDILEKAGSNTGDRVWRLPLWKHYSKSMTDYDAYDLNNIGNSKRGGSCTAAAFLREFVPQKTDWLHVDIAGVMGPLENPPYLAKGMTGRPTRTLIEFIQAQAKI